MEKYEGINSLNKVKRKNFEEFNDDFCFFSPALKIRRLVQRIWLCHICIHRRGFGFVTFASTEEASSAIQAMDGQFMSRRNLLETSNYLKDDMELVVFKCKSQEQLY
ncbi:hypothetical protein RND81_06G162500 [Saponaria officinalis]|uniref:RRM domain-containing protein n=1 Tax=Saponaria officinalis TaxID=3572 RepID=A0AAW1KC94_SAPOF